MECSAQMLKNLILAGVGAMGGLVVALIAVVILNLLSGLDTGYAASPHEILNDSVSLAVVDIVLLIAGSVFGIIEALSDNSNRRRPRLTRQRRHRVL